MEDVKTYVGVRYWAALTFARLPDFFQKDLIDVLAVEIAFEDTAGIAAFIRQKLNV